MKNYKPNISVCVQLIENEQVLLLRRFNTGYQDGKYEYPSGHIEKGESLTQAAIREVFEEVGVRVSQDDLKFIGCVDNHISGNHVNFLFKTNKFIGEPKIMEPKACDDLKWHKLSELSLDSAELSTDTKQFIDLINNNCILKSYHGKEF